MFKAEYSILLCNSPRVNTLIKSETGHTCPGRIGKNLLCVPVPHKLGGRRRDFPELQIDLIGTHCLHLSCAVWNMWLFSSESYKLWRCKLCPKCIEMWTNNLCLISAAPGRAVPEKRQLNFTRCILPSWRWGSEIFWQVCCLSQSRRPYNTVKLRLWTQESSSAKWHCEATIPVFKNSCHT